MPRGYRLVIVATLGCLILGQGEQGRAADKQHRHKQAASQPAPIPQPPNAPPAEQAKKECYPGSGVAISCDGISAQAAVDQARDADKQAATVWWQFGVSAATLAAAVAAAAFAWSAAYHTKRSADSAILSQRPWLDLAVSVQGVALIENGLEVRVKVVVNNIGNTPATNIKVHLTGHLLDTTISLKSADEDKITAYLNVVYTSRDNGIRDAIKRARDRLLTPLSEGRSLFPSDNMVSFIETRILGKTNDLNTGYIVAAVTYEFSKIRGETVKVFWARTMGTPNPTGFDSIGDFGMTFTDVDQPLEPWPQFGYVS